MPVPSRIRLPATQIPPGPWLRPAAYRRTPGLHRGARAQSGFGCWRRGSHRVPNFCWPMLRLIDERRGSPPRHSFLLQISSVELLGVGQFRSSSSDAGSPGIRRGMPVPSRIRLPATQINPTLQQSIHRLFLQQFPLVYR